MELLSASCHFMELSFKEESLKNLSPLAPFNDLSRSRACSLNILCLHHKAIFKVWGIVLSYNVFAALLAQVLLNSIGHLQKKKEQWDRRSWIRPRRTGKILKILLIRKVMRFATGCRLRWKGYDYKPGIPWKNSPRVFKPESSEDAYRTYSNRCTRRWRWFWKNWKGQASDTINWKWTAQ